MTALHRAVSLPEMHQTAMLVTDDLHFDVSGLGDVAFDVHVRIAKVRLRFAACALEGIRHFPLIPDHADAASTSAGRRLDHQWKTELFAKLLCFVQ